MKKHAKAKDGALSLHICPDCGGVAVEEADVSGALMRFRCKCGWWGFLTKAVVKKPSS